VQNYTEDSRKQRGDTRIGTGLSLHRTWPHEAATFSGTDDARPLPPLLVLAGLIELVGGALIIVRLFTKIAAFICAGQLAVADFGFHVLHGLGNAPGPISLAPVVNHGTEPALEAIIFLSLAAAGAELGHRMRS